MGSGIFKSGNPEQRAKAIVQAVTHYKDAKLLAEVRSKRFLCMCWIASLVGAKSAFYCMCANETISIFCVCTKGLIGSAVVLPVDVSAVVCLCDNSSTHVHCVCVQVSAGLGEAMVGISDLRRDVVNFRDREGGAKTVGE